MSGDLDPDMAVCANLREADVFLHVTNRGTFGHLVNADDFDTSHTHNELWELIRNKWVQSTAMRLKPKGRLRYPASCLPPDAWASPCNLSLQCRYNAAHL